ncbi:MAG: helix-turn-helix domain-containing protein [Lachnospiraceae bacterium]|nr:helix-turn-helix domain-containing protein [Lachnospiraceae bacterium]
MISYAPFYKTLLKKRISQYQLITKYLISNGTLQRIKNNQNVSLQTIENICKALNCKITDVVTFI